ncbi:MAG: hypothetical protein N7Q72_05845, partial [Spiroplasma sp. Tabriz.8]|nr:hypothetical protein [Spiroplasma sp. Tabriz.8]
MQKLFLSPHKTTWIRNQNSDSFSLHFCFREHTWFTQLERERERERERGRKLESNEWRSISKESSILQGLLWGG